MPDGHQRCIHENAISEREGLVIKKVAEVFLRYTQPVTDAGRLIRVRKEVEMVVVDLVANDDDLNVKEVVAFEDY